MATITESKLKKLPLSSIRESETALRKVNKKDPKYPEFVDSIRTNGVYNPITVRECRDGEGNLFYSLVDGLHRFTGSLDAGLTTIPAHILNMEQGEVLTAQIIANVQKIETKPVEYSKQLERILKQNPMWTMTDLANKINKSVTWLSQRLKLVNLPENIAKLVDDDKIVVSNAYALVDLHDVAPNEVGNFLDRAQTMPPGEFAANISTRVKEVKAARKQGREDTKRDEFVPIAFLQKKKTITDEFEHPSVMGPVLTAMEAKTPEDGFRACLSWALHMDPLSIEEGRRNFEAEKATQAEEREKRKREREREKAEAAAKNTVDATERPNPDKFVKEISEAG